MQDSQSEHICPTHQSARATGLEPIGIVGATNPPCASTVRRAALQLVDTLTSGRNVVDIDGVVMVETRSKGGTRPYHRSSWITENPLSVTPQPNPVESRHLIRS
jgi:hypothetical protein